MRAVVVFASAVVITFAAFGQKVDVTLSHTGQDPVGERLAYFVKNGIRGSTIMNLVGSSEHRLGVYLVTMPRDSSNPSLSTVYSISWTLGGALDDVFLSSSVGICGTERVQSCAEGLVADTDARAERWLAAKRKNSSR